MLSNIKNKLWCLIAIWFASWLLHIPCLAENISADQFLINGRSAHRSGRISRTLVKGLDSTVCTAKHSRGNHSFL